MTAPGGAALRRAALAVLAAALGSPVFGADKPAVKNAPAIQQYYKEAFESYAKGDYRQAIAKWTAIMKEDPDQKTAAAMILDARQKLLGMTKELRQRLFDLIAAGEYQKALQELQKLLDQDPGSPQLLALQGRLTGVSKLCARLPPRTKAARAAALGLKGYLTLPPDLTLAHNGLRYAVEIAPGQDLYKNLLGVVVAEFPALATADPVTPGMKFLEFKHYVALHQIYDGKYHLAVLTLDEILQLDPDDLVALKRLGSAYFSLRRMEDARAAWSAALKLQPQDKTLQRFIAKTRSKTYTSSGKSP